MGAQAKYSRALSAANELAQSASGDLESRLSVAKLHTALGVVLARARRYTEARQEFSTALTRFEGTSAWRLYKAEETDVPAAAKTGDISASAKERNDWTMTASNCVPLASLRRRTASSKGRPLR